MVWTHLRTRETSQVRRSTPATGRRPVRTHTPSGHDLPSQGRRGRGFRETPQVVQTHLCNQAIPKMRQPALGNGEPSTKTDRPGE